MKTWKEIREAKLSPEALKEVDAAVAAEQMDPEPEDDAHSALEDERIERMVRRTNVAMAVHALAPGVLEAVRDWAASPGHDRDHATLRLRVDAYLKACEDKRSLEDEFERLKELVGLKAEQDKRGLEDEG